MKTFYHNKKVLITGHTGFKGAYLIKILQSFGSHITGFALAEESNSLFASLNLAQNIKHIIGDIRDYQHLKQVIDNTQPDIIFHMAAQALVRPSFDDPLLTYSTNVMGTANIMQSLRGSSCTSFVNITTDKVYQNNEWCYGYRENESLNGFDPYSNSKSCSDIITQSFSKSFAYNCAISTARSGNVIGFGDISKDRILVDCIQSAQNKEAIIIRNPSSTRPYQHVLDCLNGYLTLAYLQYQDRNLQGAYNFGPDDSSNLTTLQLVELFCKFNNASYQIQVQENAGEYLHEANFLKLDISKARQLLNWQPKWTIDRAMQEITANLQGKSLDDSIAEFFHE
jgi:CDP-glucose 4,6-dehydratase